MHINLYYIWQSYINDQHFFFLTIKKKKWAIKKNCWTINVTKVERSTIKCHEKQENAIISLRSNTTILNDHFKLNDEVQSPGFFWLNFWLCPLPWDNAPVHTAQIVREFLATKWVEVFDHPPPPHPGPGTGWLFFVPKSQGIAGRQVPGCWDLQEQVWWGHHGHHQGRVYLGLQEDQKCIRIAVEYAEKKKRYFNVHSGCFITEFRYLAETSTYLKSKIKYFQFKS